MRCIPVDPDPDDMIQNDRAVVDEEIAYAGDF
jgi:hypothetical protein